MKKILIFVTAILTWGVLFGCDSSTENLSDSTHETNSAEAIDISKGANDTMLERSILFEGDTSRLAEKLYNIEKNPKDITQICFLGDSITQGSAASSPANQYTGLFQKWWEDNISYYAEFTNAGIGATTSYLGVHRVQSHVLDKNPDIIFIEFINDTDDEFYKASMDSLVRKCLSQKNNPAVIMIEMTMDDGTSPQNVHSEIAKAYGVPVISYHDAIMPEIEAGTINWADISPDNIHPNDAGHKMLAQMLENYIQQVRSKLNSIDKESKPFEAQSPTGDKYAKARLADRNSYEVTVTDEGNFTETASFQKFNAGWATESGGEAVFEMEFQNLGIAYLKTTDGLSADVTITVDGKQVKPITGNFPDGWGNYVETDELYVSDKAEKHTVKISVDEGDAKNFQILTWLLS